MNEKPDCPRCKTNVNMVYLNYNKFRCAFCGEEIKRNGQTTLEIFEGDLK